MSYPHGDPDWDGRDPSLGQGQGAAPSSRSGLVWVLSALVSVLLVSLVGVVGYFLVFDTEESAEAPAEPTPTAPVAEESSPSPPSDQLVQEAAPQRAACDPDEIAAEAGIDRRHVNVDRCLGDWALAHVYVPPGEPAGDTQYIVSRQGGSWSRYTSIPSWTCRADAMRDGMPGELAEMLDECAASTPTGDLGLSVPMSRPSCDGRGIVVLYSAVTPGAYAQEISTALAQFPGSSYLRTDMACPSLRQRDDNGNVIYAVYRPSGYSQQELCADVRAAGPQAYGRWLDNSSDPSALVTC